MPWKMGLVGGRARGLLRELDPAAKPLWLAMLAMVQFMDVLTSRLGMASGGIEGDRFSAELMSLGGIQFFWLAKTCVLLVVLAVMVTVDRVALRAGTPTSRLASLLLWRAIQVCTVVLLVVVAHNLGVIGVQQGWLRGTFLASLV